MIGAVVLAAGAATRYGSPKQLVFLPAVLERLTQTSVGEIVVVEGAYPLDELGLSVRVVRCPDWERGGDFAFDQRGAGGGAAGGRDGGSQRGHLVGRARCDVARDQPAPVVAASYDGTRDHPAVLSREVWDEVPDEGARALDAALVPADDLEPPGDFDYPPGSSSNSVS